MYTVELSYREIVELIMIAGSLKEDDVEPEAAAVVLKSRALFAYQKSTGDTKFVLNVTRG